MVARDGIEPPTPAFSGPRSTTELPGLSEDSRCTFLRGVRHCRKRAGSTNSALQQLCQYINSLRSKPNPRWGSIFPDKIQLNVSPFGAGARNSVLVRMRESLVVNPYAWAVFTDVRCNSMESTYESIVGLSCLACLGALSCLIFSRAVSCGSPGRARLRSC